MRRDLPSILRVVSESDTRFRIFELLCEGRHHPDDIAHKLGVSRPAVDQHLKPLYESELILRTEDKEGKIYYEAAEWARGFLTQVKQAHATPTRAEAPVVFAAPKPKLEEKPEKMEAKIKPEAFIEWIKKHPAGFIALLPLIIGLIGAAYGISLGAGWGASVWLIVWCIFITPTTYITAKWILKTIGIAYKE